MERERWQEECARMYSIELDVRISIIVDIGRYSIGSAKATRGM